MEEYRSIGVSNKLKYLFLSKTLNKVFQIIRDFVCKQGEHIYRGAFLSDNGTADKFNNV